MKELSPFEQWQLETKGNYIPEGMNEESETEEQFPKEKVDDQKINGDDDFNFHPDWCYI